MKDWHKSVVYQIYPKSFNSYYNRETGDIKRCYRETRLFKRTRSGLYMVNTDIPITTK